MTPEQIYKAKTLWGLTTFRVGCYDKRFARNMASLALHNPDQELTVNQAWYLDKLIYKYRRQLKGKIEIPVVAPPPPVQISKSGGAGETKRPPRLRVNDCSLLPFPDEGGSHA